jgi:topoisomerase-4 subunit A
VAEVKVVDEPVTVVVSAKGLGARRTGHGHEAASFAFKAGDGLYGTFECRTVDTLLAFGSNGRVYSVAGVLLPGARGDGQPVTTLIELEAGTQPAALLCRARQATLLLSAGSAATASWRGSTHGVAPKGRQGLHQPGRRRKVCVPRSHGAGKNHGQAKPLLPATHVACASVGGRILTFEIGELKPWKTAAAA